MVKLGRIDVNPDPKFLGRILVNPEPKFLGRILPNAPPPPPPRPPEVQIGISNILSPTGTTATAIFTAQNIRENTTLQTLSLIHI